MNYANIVSALKEEFPKANKSTVSMALHTEEYGVKFCQRAQEIYDGVAHGKPRRENRTKGNMFACRLTESVAESVKRAMTLNNISSVQTLLEMLLTEWVKENAVGWDKTDGASDATETEYKKEKEC